MKKLTWHNETRKLSELIPYDKNPRRLTDKQKKDLTASLKKFNLVEIPAICGKKIISGHQRIKILKELGEVQEIDVRVPNRELTEAEYKEYLVRANRNNGEWDLDILEEFWDKEELIVWGFEDEEFGNTNVGWEVKIDKTDGDGIEEKLGYNLASIWKDMPRAIEQHQYQIKLPINENGSPLHSGFSRTILEEIRRIILTYMRKGDYFLENCCGWSTFGSMAKYYGYSGIGVDIWDIALKNSKKQILKMPGDGEVEIKEMDGMNLKFNNNTFDYIYCNPPFMNEEKYSNTINDIADKDFNSFGNKFIKLMQENYRVLKKDCLCTITINDKREKGFLIPIQKYVIEWGKKAGFKLWDFVIAENIGKALIMRKRDFKLKRTSKCHEYIITFKKNG